MSFSDLIGHERPIRLLKAMLTAGRLPHALLLVGPAGVGKRTMAVALAQAANCLNPAEGEPCGVCKACDKIRRNVHPDVSVLELEGRAKIITVEAIREVRTKIAYRPFEGLTKVYIIPGAEKMQEPAANALLKTLEEPPPSSLLVLTTPEEAGLLPTIVSRCLKLNLAPLPVVKVEEWLARNRGIAGPQAKLLASMSGGCLGNVREIDPEAIFEKRRKLVEAFGALDSRRPGSGLNWAAEAAGDEESWPVNLGLLRFWYRDLMLLTGGGRGMVNLDLAVDLEKSAAGRKSEDFISALEAIDKAEDALNRFIRPELVFENLVLTLADLGRKTWAR
jgi:DNA polymerase-3 subunit delta'